MTTDHNATLTQQVLDAAQVLVDAFARNDTEAYFAAFSEDATFIFHTTPGVLTSRAAYRAMWDGSQQDGFEVLGCESSNPVVSLQGDVAIFMHEVATRLRLGGAELHGQERETIVFRKAAETGRWLAVHEHLSAMP